MGRAGQPRDQFRRTSGRRTVFSQACEGLGARLPSGASCLALPRQSNHNGSCNSSSRCCSISTRVLYTSAHNTHFGFVVLHCWMTYAVFRLRGCMAGTLGTNPINDAPWSPTCVLHHEGAKGGDVFRTRCWVRIARQECATFWEEEEAATVAVVSPRRLGWVVPAALPVFCEISSRFH